MMVSSFIGSISWVWSSIALAASVPCFDTKGTADDRETLARLVLAEGISTACLDGREEEVLGALAWGVMNRVRLGERSPDAARRYGRGVKGVVFKPGQFNPAVSKRSRFAAYFACPARAPGASRLWPLALAAAARAMDPEATNPFLISPWEKRQGLSLVTQFYYPRSEQATRVPPAWADPKSKAMAQDLGPGCVQFFRTPPPKLK